LRKAVALTLLLFLIFFLSGIYFLSVPFKVMNSYGGSALSWGYVQLIFECATYFTVGASLTVMSAAFFILSLKLMEGDGNGL